MKFFYSIILFLFTYAAIGQNSTPEFKKAMTKAKVYIEIGDYYGALTIYKELYQKDTTDAELNFQLGLCYFNLAYFNEAEVHFNKTTPSVSVELFRYKAAVAHANQKFKKALNFYNGYKIIAGKKELSNDEINRLINQVSYAELAIKNKRNITIENLGSTINTPFDDYNPQINADASLFIFTSNREKNIYNIYQSGIIKNQLAEPKKVNSNVNSNDNEIAAGLSADGQMLFIHKTNKFFVGSNLYTSQMGLDEWETPIKLPKEINSTFNETNASITTENSTIYFSSDKPGGYGGKDIYKISRLPNGEWAMPENLGPIVNTPYNEDAPFIHNDNKTLYFSSQGHQNMGGYDLFKTEFTNNTWTNPENLGVPINSVRDETNIVLTADGKIGYLASTRENGIGGKDIYKAVINDPPTNVLILKGKAFDKKTNEMLITKVTLIETESKKVQGIYKAKSSSGEFILLIEPDKIYNILIEADGYHPISEELNFDIKKLAALSYKMELKK
ncbi:MAG: hypothetical protein CVT95_03195 [Bacteroidetes bacterium HGW-Bacteroidetes-12]|nr:MAG: hypothetical protein CVT95_03195 [Bacteroidetes bacterium HGW-Bacteroidetes-12]